MTTNVTRADLEPWSRLTGGSEFVSHVGLPFDQEVIGGGTVPLLDVFDGVLLFLEFLLSAGLSDFALEEEGKFFNKAGLEYFLYPFENFFFGEIS